MKWCPWATMWFRPRQTMQRLKETNPKRGFLLLSWIYGFPMLLRLFQEISLGENLGLAWIVLIAAVAALPAGWLILQYTTTLVFLLGKIVKGAGSYIDVRAAVSWANVTALGPLVMWIVLFCTFGHHLFFLEFYNQIFTRPETILLAVNFVVIALFSIWWIILFLHALGEVQGFSFWMALLNGILAAIVFMLVGWGIGAIFHYFIQRGGA